MTTAPAATAVQHLVRARIGGLQVAIPAGWVSGALANPGPLTPLPRRRGAVAGLLHTAHGVIPAIDLARWVNLPAPPAEPDAAPGRAEPNYLLLQQDGRRLALQVDELLGLQRVSGDRVQRLHHRDDPEELFDAVLTAPSPGEAAVCVLEPQRLMALLALWCDDSAAPATESAAGAAAHRPTVALLRVADRRRLAVDMRHVAELVPMPPLASRLAPGSASAGFARWRHTTVAVLNTGWLHGRPDREPLALALVLQDDGGRAIALPVQEVLGVAPLPAATLGAQADGPAWFARHWTDADGAVDLLDVPALLDALPESSLPKGRAPATDDTRRRNDRPYFIVRAGHPAALPIEEVLAVVDPAPALDGQTTLAWRGRQLALRGQATPGGVVVVLQAAGDAVALHVEQLLGLVPAGAAELSAMPGAHGARMLHLPSAAASYAVSSAAELLRA